MIGRLSDSEKSKSVLHDAPEKQMAAVMSKLDELIDATKALCAKLDAASTVGTDYAALISDQIEKITLHL